MNKPSGRLARQTSVSVKNWEQPCATEHDRDRHELGNALTEHLALCQTVVFLVDYY